MNNLKREARKKKRILHTRRKRRQERQALKFGREAKPRHTLQAGRTGSVHKKKTASKQELSLLEGEEFHASDRRPDQDIDVVGLG